MLSLYEGGVLHATFDTYSCCYHFLRPWRLRFFADRRQSAKYSLPWSRPNHFYCLLMVCYSRYSSNTCASLLLPTAYRLLHCDSNFTSPSFGLRENKLVPIFPPPVPHACPRFPPSVSHTGGGLFLVCHASFSPSLRAVLAG